MIRFNQRGFTLIEMLVVVGIVIIMTGVVLANFPGFRDKTSLDLLAQEVAITIRGAQVFGTATESFTSQNIFPSYGVYLDTAQSGGFVLFADLVSPGDTKGNSKYDNGELQEQYLFRGGVGLATNGIRIYSSDDDTTEINPGLTSLSVIFQRPETEPKLYNASGQPILGFSHLNLTISDNQGKSRTIKIWKTGHIYAQPQ